MEQFIYAVRARPDNRVDEALRRLLDAERQWQLLARLGPYDRAHALAVHDVLAGMGRADPDLLRAALLHDVGKADDRGRVRTPHRVAFVLATATTPALLRRVTSHERGGLLHGIYLARQHAALGARLAADAGASPRCCELIARHECVADGDDDLVALAAADALAMT